MSVVFRYVNSISTQWFLERWDTSHAVLGLVAVIAIQRSIHKILISVFLSREFKHDETNRAWWTGRWYGRGLGAHIMSQPAREFLVKIIELSLWSSDLILGHLLLFILTPPILIPYFDRFHATILCKFDHMLLPLLHDVLILFLVWLRPSKQIRAPLFSIKQKRQRRWLVSTFLGNSFLINDNNWAGNQIWYHIHRHHHHFRRAHSPT